jgi:hypothetical protein
MQWLVRLMMLQRDSRETIGGARGELKGGESRCWRKRSEEFKKRRKERTSNLYFR